MKLLIILLFFTGCVKAQVLGVYKTYESSTLIIFGIESNSGGQALNSALTAPELAVRPSVQILNNNSKVFQSLDIGTNNNLGHDNLSTTLYHGWENGLAHRIEDGYLGTTYLVKTGQGGSTINEWDEGDPYWDSLKLRVDTALVLGNPENIFLWYSHGINDAIAGTVVATWKAATIAHFAKIRARYGFVPIFITELPSNRSTFNTAIYQIAAELEDVYVIETSDAAMNDSNHWSAVGMRLIAERIVDAMLLNY